MRQDMALVAGSAFSATEWHSLQTRQVVFGRTDVNLGFFPFLQLYASSGVEA